MAPKKKTSNMKWVVKSQQSAKMADSESDKLDCSLLPDSVSKLQLSSSSPPAKMPQPATQEQYGWSHLPEEILHIISDKLKDCFDTIHARSVCRPWRSIFPFPSELVRTSYSLPSFERPPRKSKSKGRGRGRGRGRGKGKEVCTLEKFPMFLFRVRTRGLPCEYFVGGIDNDKSEDDDMELRRPSPPQCSVKMKIPESDSGPTLVNILDCQVLSLGYQYGMKDYDPNSLATRYRGVGFLQLNKEGGEFIVLIGYGNDLYVLKSGEMRWMRFEKASTADCSEIVTFRGKFYVLFWNGDAFVIDPYSLEETPLIALERMPSTSYLVPCGNDELFFVERINPLHGVLDFSKLVCRVSRLDEEAGEWVEVTDLGDRVLLIGQPGNSFCLGKDLPDGCGVTGNSLLFINELFGVTDSYKYGVNPEDDDLRFWRFSGDTRVTILRTSPMGTHLRVDHKKP